MNDMYCLPWGHFAYGKTTASAGTAFARLIPPYRSVDSAAEQSTNVNNPAVGDGVIHLTGLRYQCGTTSHVLTFMKPLNYTTVSADAAASQAVVVLTADPGLYQTSDRYKYPLPAGMTAPATGNNGIAASDYVVYQAAAGHWVMDTVSSVSSLSVTLATNLPTGGVKAGAIFYFFGVSTDTDPQTNLAHQQADIEAAPSGTAMVTLPLLSSGGVAHALHRGDPMIIHSNNATAQGWLQLASGFYGRY